MNMMPYPVGFPSSHFILLLVRDPGSFRDHSLSVGNDGDALVPINFEAVGLEGIRRNTT
jgi:hypothetical protein